MNCRIIEQPKNMKTIAGITCALALLMTGLVLQQVNAGQVEAVYYDYVQGNDIDDFRNVIDPKRTPTHDDDARYWDFPAGATDFEVWDDLGRKESFADHFCLLLRGYITPPMAGEYVFFLASSGASELYISSDHTALDIRAEGNFLSDNPAPEAFEKGCCTKLFTGARLEERSSQALSLDKGRQYYFEAYMKEGVGAAFLEIGWKRPDGVREAIPGTALLPFIYPGSWNFASARGIVEDPQSQTVVELTPATFSVEVVMQPPLSFQWKLNGKDIPGENGSNLHIPRVDLSTMNGNRYSVTVNGRNSKTATLYVEPDSMAPRLLAAKGSGNPQGIIVSFSKAVNAAAATDVSNYVFSGQNLTIKGASMLSESAVLLDVSEYDVSPLTLSVSGVTDLATRPNSIPVNSTITVSFFSTLLAYWDFNDASDPDLTYDLIQGIPGLLRNGAFFSADGEGRSGASGDKGMDFGPDQGSEYVYVPDASFINAAAPGNKLSVTFWQKNYATPKSSAFWIVSPSSSGVERGVQAHVPWRNKSIYFDTAGCCDTGAQRIFANISSFPDYVVDFFLTWRHYAFVKDGDIKQIWIDGKLFHSGVNTGILPSDFTEMSLGSNQDGENSEAAIMDDFAIFRTALSEEEIMRLAGGDSPPECASFATALSIIQQAENVSVMEPFGANFAFTVSGGPPSSIEYQWYRDGAIIPGATDNEYAIASARHADNGAMFKCVAKNSDGSFSPVESNEIILSVIPDTTAPLVSDIQVNSLKNLMIRFGEPIDPLSGAVAAYYSLSDGASITAVSVVGDIVLLKTSALTENAVYTLSISGIEDLFGNAVPAGTTYSFSVYVKSYAEIILADEPIAYYRFNESSGSVAMNSGTLGAEADGLWMSGNGPADSVESIVSHEAGPNPHDGFLGFTEENLAASFNGALDALWIDTRQKFFNKLNYFTLACWIKPINREGGAWRRVGIVGQNDAVEYGFLDGNTIRIWTSIDGDLETDYPFADGEWHHLVTLADDTHVYNYFDGKLINSSIHPPTTYESDHNTHIGGGGVFDEAGNHFEGVLDEVAIFDKALPAARILEQYLIGRGGGELLDSIIDIVSQPSNQVALRNEPTASHHFNSDDGGFVVETVGPLPGPWRHDTSAGVWVADGSDNTFTGPYWSLLNKGYTVPKAGEVTMSFSHRYAFEENLYDAGQLRISVNDAPFVSVPAENFSAHGHAGATIIGASMLKDQYGFVEKSPGYDNGDYIDSVVSLGTFAANDKIVIQFAGAWDERATGTNPNWVIDKVEFDTEIVPLDPVTFEIDAEGSLAGQPVGLEYQWHRDDGAGFEDIPRATGSTYRLFAAEADLAARFRCVVSLLDSYVVSDTVRISSTHIPDKPTISISRDDANIIVEWTGVLQMAETLEGPWVDATEVSSPYIVNPELQGKMRFMRARN
jgi:hypothetical protein